LSSNPGCLLTVGWRTRIKCIPLINPQDSVEWCTIGSIFRKRNNQRSRAENRTVPETAVFRTVATPSGHLTCIIIYITRAVLLLVFSKSTFVNISGGKASIDGYVHRVLSALFGCDHDNPVRSARAIQCRSSRSLEHRHRSNIG